MSLSVQTHPNRSLADRPSHLQIARGQMVRHKGHGLLPRA